MDARLVVGIADLFDALRNVASEGKQFLPSRPDVLLDDREGRMRQQLHALQDGAIELKGSSL